MYELVDAKLNKLFLISRGKSKYTKPYCKQNFGEHPVYSADNNAPLSYRDDYDYDGKYITVSINGIAGVVSIMDGKFSITADRVIFIPLFPNVDITYVKYAIGVKLRNISKGRIGINNKNEFTKLTPDMIGEISIAMPLNEDGTYNLQVQNSIAERYEKINCKKKLLLHKKEEINKFQIEEFYQFNTEYVDIKEIVDFRITTNSGLTKTFVNKHKGNIPVYGASKFVDLVSYGYIADGLDNVKYFEDCLTYNKDGASGYVFYRKGKFSISEKVLPLVMFDEVKDKLSYDYLQKVIQIEAQREDFTFSNKATKIKLKELQIPIPVDKDGYYDLDAQLAIAKKYESIENIKQQICSSIDELINCDIEI